MVATRLFIRCTLLTQPASLIIHLSLNIDAVPLSFGDEDRDNQVATFPDGQAGSGLDSGRC